MTGPLKYAIQTPNLRSYDSMSRVLGLDSLILLLDLKSHLADNHLLLLFCFRHFLFRLFRLHHASSWVESCPFFRSHDAHPEIVRHGNPARETPGTKAISNLLVAVTFVKSHSKGLSKGIRRSPTVRCAKLLRDYENPLVSLNSLSQWTLK